MEDKSNTANGGGGGERGLNECGHLAREWCANLEQRLAMRSGRRDAAEALGP